MNKKQKVEPLMKETYLAAVKNSIGSKMFRNVYAKVDGKIKDITKGGDLSCAVFVSSILVWFKLINDAHATVNGTIRDLEKSGWREIKKPQAGAIIVWAKKDFDQSAHRHIGFYIGDGKAISNNSKKRSPSRHVWQSYNGRKVEQIFWHPKLK